MLLNNDVVVTEGWLDQLIALASIDPEANATPDDTESKIRNPKSKIGLVGPMSNYAAPPQLVEDVPYRDLDEMKVFARQWRDEHRGKWFTVPKLSGFCLLMKRAVYDAIGGLDERFGLGFFDDDDLAERARRAGFELAVAHDLFVHHFGSRTFVGNGIDAAKLLDENAARFAVKWGDSVPRGVRVGLRAFSSLCAGDSTGLSVHTQCVSDSTGLSGPHPPRPHPRPPLCKVGSQSARDSLALGVGDSAGLSGLHPPRPPLCKVGSQSARDSLALGVGDSAGLSGPHPPRPPLCKVGSQSARDSLALGVGDSAGLSGPHPPRPPLCKVGSRSARDSLALGAGDSAGLSGLHPPQPPLCKVGSQSATGLYPRSALGCHSR